MTIRMIISTSPRTFLQCAFFASTFLWASVGHADGSVSGTVQWVRTHSEQTNPAWKPPLFWFTINGMKATDCAIFVDGSLFVGTNADQLSFVLSAYYSNQNIAVYYSSDQKINGFCTVKWLTLGNNPPN
jgi:hypothetical protein